ncbi:MAG: MGMT family protein [Bdellovibrionales bacterium]|nr:MGMT family protein [Bdellovibrionales bacterium]
MEKFCVQSLIGPIEVQIINDRVESISKASRYYTNKKLSNIASSIKKQLEDYLWGHSKNFKFEIADKGTTFQKKVWQHLRKIPFGQTQTYSQIAKQIGHPGAARAVGTACGKNPWLLFVPCQRVIAANGTLGGFALGLNAKSKLLKLEQEKK